LTLEGVGDARFDDVVLAPTCRNLCLNPEFDTDQNLYFGAHCTCTTRLHGPQVKKTSYSLRPFLHKLPKSLALDVQWPPGETVTLCKYHSGKKQIDAWRGQVVCSPTCPPVGGCATRMLQGYPLIAAETTPVLLRYHSAAGQTNAYNLQIEGQGEVPEAHAQEQQKVMGRGHTPAGTHRPICVAEILAILDPRPGEVGLDATLGFGGHAQALLPRLLPGGRLFGVDVDPLELPRTEARLRALGFGEELLSVRRMNFAGLPGLLPEVGGFDFVLADLGVSSMQIDNPARGFTWKAEGPLDLRLNPNRGRPASALLKALSREELAANWLV